MGLKNKNGSENQSVKIGKLDLKVRRALAVLCTAALIGTCIPAISASVAHAANQTAITANTTSELNIRSGAGMTYSILKCINKDSQVNVIERVNDKWLKVRTADGTQGYCSADYIDIVTDAKAATYLNVRKGPGTNYGSIKTISPGTKMDILRFYGESWMKVKLSDGTVGYVCTDHDYVTYISGTSGETVIKNESSQKSDSSSQVSSASLKISAANKTLSVGKTCTLTATTTSGGTFTWKTSDYSVATVTSKGLVTAVKPGKATITATDNKSSKSVSCVVEVTKSQITSISLPSSSGTLVVGKTMQLVPKITPSNGKVSYRTSASNIASVTSKGLITAQSAGSCSITVYDPNGGSANAVYKLTVTKKSNASITLSSSNVSIKAGASHKLTANISTGGSVKWSSSNTNVAAVRNGVVSALSAGTATITATDSTGTASESCKVTVNAAYASGLTLSRSSETLTVGKTLYITGNSSSKMWWNVSDTSVASITTDVTTNNKGFIVANNPGKVAITYTNANGNRAICVLTVNEAEPIRYTYSSPNSATKNSYVNLIAITDKNRSEVTFEVNENGKKVTVKADSKVADGNTYVWTGKYYAKYSGTFTYSAYSKKTGSSEKKTCTDGKADIYVTAKTDKKTTAVEKLRASDEVINFIGEKEGFVPNVVPDRLANNIPTLAHGYVVWDGDKFYNGLTKKEGYALLVSAVNKENYARDVNNLLLNNGVRFNQQQFDSLVSFSYNLGTGWTYSSDLKNILLNSYGGSVSSSSGATTAIVNVEDSLNLRESYTTNSKMLEVLSPGETVTLVSTQTYNSIWYKVKTQSGKTGYCSGTYLTIVSPGGSGRDLNYVNKNSLIKCMLAYHHAGGQCYYGLLYRRADELEMFLYGDYISDGSRNKYGFPSPYCISF